jgi:poly(3-hydroxybutyrate) depolymerase
MFYQLYELNHAAMAPWRAAAESMRVAYRNPFNPMAYTRLGRTFAAGFEVFERATRRYGKPAFGLDTTVIGGKPVSVHENVVWSKPFCDLLHFERCLPSGHKKDPRILIVAPMSGHYATLLRGTVETLLPDADIYITDWKDARMVPLSEGRFDLDDYIDYVIDMIHHLGEDTHVIAVCQPSVPVLAAVARMEEEGDPLSPSSMTLMGGPIDTRINPTAVNQLAQARPLSWFEENVIMPVPWPQPGFMRPVYPGFLQLSGFMSMNLDRHMIAHKEFFFHLVKNDGEPAERHRDFYDEYLAVMDLTAEFYLQTVETVFIEHSLPKGEMTHRGKRVDPSKIRTTALLTVEGENDDISGLGQTRAAQTLCSSLTDDMRMHYMQPDVGHYGVFNGSRFRKEIAPRILKFMNDQSMATRAAARPDIRVIEGGRRRMAASGK